MRSLSETEGTMDRLTSLVTTMVNCTVPRMDSFLCLVHLGFPQGLSDFVQTGLELIFSHACWITNTVFPKLFVEFGKNMSLFPSVRLILRSDITRKIRYTCFAPGIYLFIYFI